MTHTRLTLDIDRIEVVSYATQELETPEARGEACPAASATLTNAPR